MKQSNMTYMNNNRVITHIVFEVIALVVVAPILAYIAYSNWSALPLWQTLALAVISLGTLLVDGYLLSRWASDRLGEPVVGTPEHYIPTLVRQSARWATAAKQDRNSMISVLHANYGAGYLWALKDIATDDMVRKFGGVDPIKFKTMITEIQDQSTKNMARICPKWAPESTYLSRVAGEGG